MFNYGPYRFDMVFFVILIFMNNITAFPTNYLYGKDGKIKTASDRRGVPVGNRTRANGKAD